MLFKVVNRYGYGEKVGVTKWISLNVTRLSSSSFWVMEELFWKELIRVRKTTGNETEEIDVCI